MTFNCNSLKSWHLKFSVNDGTFLWYFATIWISIITRKHCSNRYIGFAFLTLGELMELYGLLRAWPSAYACAVTHLFSRKSSYYEFLWCAWWDSQSLLGLSSERKKEGESEKEERKKDSRHHPSWPFKESSCGVYAELAQFHTSSL